MKAPTIILMVLLLTTPVASAKVSPIDIQKALQEAKTVTTVIIIGYQDY